MEFVASVLIEGPEYSFREQLFTPWMGPDAFQAHVDHMADNGMLPLYSEYEPDRGYRELYWNTDVRTYFEARAARTLEEFEELLERNQEEGHVLATLHISQDGGYSATWFDPIGLASAESCLKALGISIARILD